MVYDVLVEAFTVNDTSMTVEEFLTTNEVRYQLILEIRKRDTKIYTF
jgi:hypothetical protein